MTTPTIDDQIKHVKSRITWFGQLSKAPTFHDAQRQMNIYQAILETLRKVKAEQEQTKQKDKHVHPNSND